MIREGEHIEPLGNGVQVIVSPHHAFGTDTVLLAHFSLPGQRDKACELGTGCGAIPLIWSRENRPASVTAVDIQAEACDLLQRSIALNHLENRIQVLHSDLLDLQGTEQAHRIARHEMACTLEDIVRTAAKLLRFSGKFCLCQRPERLSDIICAMRQYDIEPKRLRFVQQRYTKAPKLFLIEGRRGGRPNGLVVEPALMMENDSGGLSEEMIAIYGAYKEAYLT